MKIDVNKDKTIEFGVKISGTSLNELNAHLKLKINKMELSFPGKFVDDTVSVTIPALSSILKEELNTGQSIPATLVVMGKSNYVVPWESNLQVQGMTIQVEDVNESKTVSETLDVGIVLKNESDEEPVKPKKITKYSNTRISKMLKG